MILESTKISCHRSILLSIFINVFLPTCSKSIIVLKKDGEMSSLESEIHETRIGNARAVGGMRTKIAKYPFVVSIRVQDKFLCAGIILKPNFILTVAHCIKPGYPHNWYTIHAKRTKKYGLEKDERTYTISKVAIHENYVRDDGSPHHLVPGKGVGDPPKIKHDNDIALIMLNDSIKFGAKASAAHLPQTSEQLAPGTYCCVVGWGETLGYGDTNELNEICIATWSRAKCNQREFHDGKVTKNMICAGKEIGGIDSCMGDSGGPLYCDKGTGVRKVWGLVSWGQGCAQQSKPGVYIDVSQKLSWIEGQIKKMSISHDKILRQTK